MRKIASAMTDGPLEQRSGLPGLGSRPSLHPAWDEDQQEGIAKAAAPVNTQMGAAGVASSLLQLKFRA